ncbi:MAG: sporulation initiation factor Spo0A [Oscillospiraceae bacterium]|nr:sporulation initiation factor Spo0A [Oscillospiraceae bacterium]
MANIRKILMKIAAENHTTVAEVRREISIAIEEGMKCSDPEIQKKWRTMSRTGGIPTPEEAILFLSREAKKK